MLQRFERDILLAHLDSMQRRRRDAEPAGKGREGHLPAPLAQEMPKLLLQGRCHGGSVPLSCSHIWEISLVCACLRPLKAYNWNCWKRNSAQASLENLN